MFSSILRSKLRCLQGWKGIHFPQGEKKHEMIMTCVPMKHVKFNKIIFREKKRILEMNNFILPAPIIHYNYRWLLSSRWRSSAQTLCSKKSAGPENTLTSFHDFFSKSCDNLTSCTPNTLTASIITTSEVRALSITLDWPWLNKMSLWHHSECFHLPFHLGFSETSSMNVPNILLFAAIKLFCPSAVLWHKLFFNSCSCSRI